MKWADLDWKMQRRRLLRGACKYWSVQSYKILGIMSSEKSNSVPLIMDNNNVKSNITSKVWHVKSTSHNVHSASWVWVCAVQSQVNFYCPDNVSERVKKKWTLTHKNTFHLRRTKKINHGKRNSKADFKSSSCIAILVWPHTCDMLQLEYLKDQTSQHFFYLLKTAPLQFFSVALVHFSHHY